DPKRRYQSADDLLVALRQPTTTLGTPRSIAAKSRLPLVVGAAAILIVLIATLMVIRGRGSLFASRPPQSIAVVRFENVSGKPDDEVFADATGQDLLWQLMKTSSLRVTTGGSSFNVKRGTAIPDLARQLHASKVIGGSVQRNGARAVVKVRLYDGENGQELWSQVYDRAADDLSLVPSVALDLFDRLGVRLTGAERQRLVAAPQQARRVK